jgi:ABC-type lipoprotein export system ATPase subunit
MEVETLKIHEANVLIDFFEKGTSSNIKEWSELREKKETIKKELSTLKMERDNYLTEKAPAIVLNKMTKILERFNLSFKLQPNPISRTTSEFPFSFKVVDEDGNSRDIKNGLSEGERQLVSLAFFFALNEKTLDKGRKVIVFDDPITSLDSANLKTLADLIHEQVQQKVFAQVIILTHHPLFHKYLAKKQDPNANKFGILKNHGSFGGSFIYFDSGFDTTERLKNCQLDIQTRAQEGGLNVEDVALQYGQLLRISIERFIKNDLLLWSADKFDTVVAGLKEGQSKIKKLDQKDIETIVKIYKYCNYSNLLHADKEVLSALTELINHIGHFITTLDKVSGQQPNIV